MDEERIRAGIEPLLLWFEQVRKPLPWRADPTPYHVWISEIMLQQTRIEAVIPYYERFLAAFPDVASLAAAPDDLLMKKWEGLGYYSRARNLKQAAQIIVSDYHGALPADAETLRKLPGIGDYTAGAISSLAYHRPAPAVDGNVLRVIARLTADDRDVMRISTRRDVSDALRAVYPTGERAARLTEGLMELGERVCLPNGEPLCGECPWRTLCLARERNETDRYPVRTKPKERRIEHRVVLLLRCGDRYAVRKRPKSGLLAGMWEFPNYLAGSEPTYPQSTPCGAAKHVFSHVEWHMQGYRAELPQETADYVWKTRDEILRDCALPTAFRFYRDQL